MKTSAIVLAVVGSIAATSMASATYRVSPTASFQERDRYETYHTSINAFHPSESATERKTQKLRVENRQTVQPQTQNQNVNDPHEVW